MTIKSSSASYYCCGCCEDVNKIGYYLVDANTILFHTITDGAACPPFRTLAVVIATTSICYPLQFTIVKKRSQ